MLLFVRPIYFYIISYNAHFCSSPYTGLYTSDTSFDAECGISDVASACANNEHYTCMRSENATVMEALYCPIYECVAEVEGIDEILTQVDTDTAAGLYYSVNALYLSAIIGVCTYCVGYKSLCEFCDGEPSWESEGASCTETNEVCKNHSIYELYQYSSECLAYVTPTGGTEPAITGGTEPAITTEDATTVAATTAAPETTVGATTTPEATTTAEATTTVADIVSIVADDISCLRLFLIRVLIFTTSYF